MLAIYDNGWTHGTTLWRVSKSNNLERITNYPSGNHGFAANLVISNEGTDAAYILSNRSVIEISLKDGKQKTYAQDDPKNPHSWCSAGKSGTFEDRINLVANSAGDLYVLGEHGCWMEGARDGGAYGHGI